VPFGASACSSASQSSRARTVGAICPAENLPEWFYADLGVPDEVGCVAVRPLIHQIPGSVGTTSSPNNSRRHARHPLGRIGQTDKYWRHGRKMNCLPAREARPVGIRPAMVAGPPLPANPQREGVRKSSANSAGVCPVKFPEIAHCPAPRPPDRAAPPRIRLQSGSRRSPGTTGPPKGAEMPELHRKPVVTPALCLGRGGRDRRQAVFEAV